MVGAIVGAMANLPTGLFSEDWGWKLG